MFGELIKILFNLKSYVQEFFLIGLFLFALIEKGGLSKKKAKTIQVPVLLFFSYFIVVFCDVSMLTQVSVTFFSIFYVLSNVYFWKDSDFQFEGTLWLALLWSLLFVSSSGSGLLQMIGLGIVILLLGLFSYFGSKGPINSAFTFNLFQFLLVAWGLGLLAHFLMPMVAWKLNAVDAAEGLALMAIIGAYPFGRWIVDGYQIFNVRFLICSYLFRTLVLVMLIKFLETLALRVDLIAVGPALALYSLLSGLIWSVLLIRQKSLSRMFGYFDLLEFSWIVAALIFNVSKGSEIPINLFVLLATSFLMRVTLLAYLRQRESPLKVSYLLGLSRSDRSAAAISSFFFLHLTGIPLTAGYVFHKELIDIFVEQSNFVFGLVAVEFLVVAMVSINCLVLLFSMGKKRQKNDGARAYRYLAGLCSLAGLFSGLFL